MLGAVQFGLLAACVVLFVPMGMAGWHLSRNKVLLFSGALFITLAVGVHLTPYLSSFSHFRNPISSSFVPLENRDSCISLLHEIAYDVTIKEFAETWNSSSNHVKSWRWVDSPLVLGCGFKKLGRADASDLLNGSWVVVAGDSQARLVMVSLLNLVLGPQRMESVKQDLFKRHNDYQIIVDEYGMKLDFIWAPYVTNITDFILELKKNKHYPDVLVIGAGLWDMLHITNPLDYGSSLLSLRNSVVSLLPISSEFDTDGSLKGSIASPHLFWLGMPVLINSMLNTEEKREKMNNVMCDAYDTELQRSKLMRSSDGPLLLLDVHKLSWKCGHLCSVDGMHYDASVYEPAVHIMLNALLIESHQKL